MTNPGMAMTKQEVRVSRAGRTTSHAHLHRMRVALLRDQAFDALRRLTRAREAWHAGMGSAGDNNLAALTRALDAVMNELRHAVTWGRLIEQLMNGRGPGRDLVPAHAASGGGSLPLRSMRRGGAGAGLHAGVFNSCCPRPRPDLKEQ